MGRSGDIGTAISIRGATHTHTHTLPHSLTQTEGILRRFLAFLIAIIFFTFFSFELGIFFIFWV